MAKIDYTNEYRELLEALVSNNPNFIDRAARAMGLHYDANPINIILQIDERFVVSGPSADMSNCVLKEEYCL